MTDYDEQIIQEAWGTYLLGPGSDTQYTYACREFASKYGWTMGYGEFRLKYYDMWMKQWMENRPRY